MTRPNAAERWRGLVRRQAESGSSVAEFCRRHDISEASFYPAPPSSSITTSSIGRSWLIGRLLPAAFFGIRTHSPSQADTHATLTPPAASKCQSAAR